MKKLSSILPRSLDVGAFHCEIHGPFQAFVMDGHAHPKCPLCIEISNAQESIRQQQNNRIAANESRLKKLAEQSGIGARFAHCSFDNFVICSPTQSLEQSKVLNACRMYAENFRYVYEEGASLLLVGETGTGKGHLSGSIVKSVVLQGYTALFVKWMWVIEAIRSDVSLGDSYNTRMDFFARQDLLVLDEVGMQRNTDDERLMLERLVDMRHELKRPSIFISNLHEQDFAELVGPRVVSRLKEQKVRALRFTWEDQRQSFAKDRPSWMTIRQYPESR